MKKLILALLLSPWAVCHASPSPSDSLHSCLFFEPGQAPVPPAAGKRLAGLDAGEPRTVRMFYFLPNDRPYRAEVVQRTKDEMVRIQGWFGEQMEAHGHGYMTFRLETDDQGEPVVHRVDGRRPDRHYIDDTWAAVWETGEAFDLSRSIVVVVVDNATNRINRTATGAATSSSKESGVALVGGEFAWHVLAHELAHSFGMGHDFRSNRHILSYGRRSRDSLSACSAEALAVHPYFNRNVGVEWGEPPAVDLLSAQSYPEGSESVPIRLRLSDADGLQLVRVRVPTRHRNDPSRYAGGWELKTCRSLTGEREAVVEIEYDGVIPTSSAYGFSDLADSEVHPISLTVIDRDGNRGGLSFDLWQVSRQHLATFELLKGVHGLAFAAGALVSGSGEGVRFWDLAKRTGRAAPLAGGTAVAVSADGATLASGTGSGHVQLLDLGGGEVIGTLSGPLAPVRSLAFSPDGATLAWADQDGIHLWDLAARARTATLPVGAAALAFSPDGATLASGSGDGVRLWNVERRAEVSNYRHGGWPPGVHSVAFSPDGTLLVSGGEDWTARLWDVGTNEAVAVLDGHDGPVRAVGFSPDGTLLASGADMAVNLWDSVSRKRLAALRGEGGKVNTLAFSPDGRTAAAGTEDGRIGLWDISEWVRPRPLTLAMVSGDGQQGTSGEPLADPFVIEVRDQYGEPLPGVQVTFTVTGGDGLVAGRFTQERTTSDANGRSEAILTLGPAEGTNTVEAEVAGLAVVAFRASAAGDPATPRMEGDFHAWHLPDAATVRLKKGRLAKVAFSPKGGLLAVGTYLGVWLYDLATSREVALLPGRRVFGMAFSPDGRILASCGAYKDKIRLWEVATGNQIASIDHRAWSVTFSPDGSTLASGSDFGIELWDVETWTQAAGSVEGVIGGVRSVAFSPDGRTLAAGAGWGHRVTLWDVATATRTGTFEGHKADVTSVSFSPDGRTLASGSEDDTVKLWDVATGSEVATFEHASFVQSVSFSPDGRTLASGSADDFVRFWDLATGQAVALEGLGPWVVSVSFSPDGTTLASGSNDGTVSLWEVATGNAAPIARGHLAEASAVALSPGGNRVASPVWGYDGDYHVGLWDAATGRKTAALRGHRSRITAVAFSPDGATLASGGRDRTIRLWDVATGTEIATLEAPDRRWISVVAFSSDGSRIASGHADGAVRVWDVATGADIVTLEGVHVYGVASLAFAPDGATLASVSTELVLWDLATATPILTQEGPRHVSFAPDGTALAIGWDWDAQVTSVWKVPAGGDAATLSYRYREGAFVTAFSPDGSTLVAENFVNNVSVLEVREVGTGSLIASLEGHGEQVEALAFSRDGSTFASSSHDGTVLVWDLGRVLPHPRALGQLSGDGQEGPPNAALADPLVVEVRDQHGDLLQGAEVTFAVTGGGGTLSVETAATDARGRAAATLTLGLAPGPNTVEVTVGDLEPVVFTALTRAIPTTLAVTGGDDQQGPSGSPLAEPFVVSLLDQAGGPLAGVAVTFAVMSGGGTLSVTRAATDARGRAATDLTLGRAPGANSVRATAAGLAPVTFTALGVLVPGSLAKLSGDEQVAEPGAALTEPLVVEVRDQHGAALPGAVVTFAVVGEAGTLSASRDTTDAEGRASAVLTLGEEYGACSVVATAADLEPVTFTAAARPTPDFDGDGLTGLSDFFLFAEALGGSDPRFDLDGDGSVDVADFFLFAEGFGPQERARLVAMARELIGLPDGPQLRQNAPNPFNSQTVIAWFLPEPGPARLEVFALTGQRVAVLHQGPGEAGPHRLRWDGRDDQGRPLGSGVYVCRLLTSGGAQTRKLTLLR